MSREDLELVRDLNAAFKRGEEDWVELYDADVEYVMPPEWPEDHVYRGREAVRDLGAAMARTFAGHRWSQERLIDAGAGRVVSLLHAHGGIGGEGEGEVVQRIGAVLDVRDGKVVRQQTFFSWEEALGAAGRAAG